VWSLNGAQCFPACYETRGLGRGAYFST
jgi:hypothetical protein